MTETELRQIFKELLEEVESEFVEHKLSDKTSFGEYVSALSNGACLRNKDFGYLLFGVNDKTKKVEGTTVKKSDLTKAKITAALEPKIDYSVHDFEYQNKKVILVKISAANGQPTKYLGQSYARIGEDKTALKNLTPGQIQKIYNSTTDWSSQISDTATLGDLDVQAIKKAKEKFKEKAENRDYAKEINGWSDSVFLDKAGITIKGKITNCALILLGKRESKSLLKHSNASEITWELRDERGLLSSYERFYPPFLLSIEKVWSVIRNTKYLHPTNQLLNLEVLKYDNKTITEALNNCIAHQKYFSNDRGIVIAEKIDRLIFENFGNFFEGKPEDYVLGKAKAQNYRNPLLVSAMTNLGMIDKMGTGIGTMYEAQRRRFFPMPDYSKSTSEKVILQIYGKIIDEKFSQILMEKQDLDLSTIISLDRVQKKILIDKVQANYLRKQGLIEGERPNYFVSSKVAETVNQKAKYIKNRAFDDGHYSAMILQFLRTYKKVSRPEIDDLLISKLSEILSENQKKKKITNLLQKMSKKDRTIKNEGTNRNPVWVKL